MPSPLAYAAQNLDAGSIHQHFQDSTRSLNLYFDPSSPDYFIRFAAYSAAELRAELTAHLHETELTSSLTLLACIEAMFQLDFRARCARRLKDPLSRSFRQLNKNRKRVRLDEDVLESWYTHAPSAKSAISNLRGALQFRHWLAHGRYWLPKLGRRYDYTDISVLAAQIASFPFEA